MSAGSVAVPTRTVVDELAEVMVEHGCDHLFTLMGAGNLWLVSALDLAHGVPIHHLRHENGAVGAADGLARATGRLAWCTVTQGPGFTNTITALLTADRAGTPLVMLVSDTSNLDPFRFPFAGGVQALAPELLLQPLGIATERAAGEDAAERLRAAARRAVEESRPVVFVMPAGLDKLPAAATATAAEPAIEDPDPMHRPSTPRAPLPASVLQEAVAIIRSASRPLLLVGRGAFGAESQVAALAESLDCDVATSVPASGILGDHPAVIGPYGGFSIGETERRIQAADCVIAVGVALNLFQTRKGSLLEGRAVVRIDRAPSPASGAARTVDLLGDASEVIAQLLPLLPDASATSSRRQPVGLPGVSDPVDEPGLMDPRTLCLELDRVLPRPRRIVVDNGHFGAFPMLYMRHLAARSLVWLPDFGAVGSALAAAYASSIVDPDTTTVLFIGDCGLYMTLGDLETAVRERAPLVVVCMNDGAAGSELAHMKDWNAPPEQAIFGYADLGALATGMGATGRTVTALSDLPDVVSSWDPASGPLLLDCHISRAVRSPIYDHV